MRGQHWEPLIVQKIEMTGDRVLTNPQTEILHGTELINRAKLYRVTGKSGYMICPCDIKESGTAEMLDLIHNIPIFIPHTCIKRENPNTKRAER